MQTPSPIVTAPRFDPIHPVFRPGTLVPEEELHRYLKACGRGARIYAGARIVFPERVSVGDYAQVDESVHLFGGEGIALGRHVHLAFLSSISGGGRCVIGDFAGIGAGVRIITGTEATDGSGLTNPTVPAACRTVTRGLVTIGAHAVVFTNSVVLPGVAIGEGAVVAAGSVVHRDLKPWGIYAGSPLTQVGVRDRDRILALAAELTAAESAA